MRALPAVLLALVAAALPAAGQRITTIQLDGVQYFISRMNPYSPELNYFLAYQYCRSLGLQLASFETKEKADSITSYLGNAGFKKYDFWTSGNNLGTDMFLWMSTGLPFNATFNYMRRGGDLSIVPGTEQSHTVSASMDPLDIPQGSTAPQRTARHDTEHILSDGCVALKGPGFHWEPQHCGEVKDFICEQTRCYYYNYGSIPVSSAQGKPLSLTTTTTATPLTSSSPVPPRSEHLPTHFTLNDLLGKLRPSSLDGLQSPHLKAASALAHKNPPQIDGHYSGIKHHERTQDSLGQSNEKEATLLPSTYDGDADLNENPTHVPNDPNNVVDEDDSATIGPYNHNPLFMGDDPNAYVAAANAYAAPANGNSEDDYISTIEPDVATTYKSELLQKIIGKVLAAPSL